MTKFLFVFLLSLIDVYTIWAQSAENIEYLKVGEPLPTSIAHNIRYYSKREEDLSAFRGKWLVVDFWNNRCSSCIETLPKINEVQKDLGDKVQVLMVAVPFSDDRSEERRVG